MPYVTVDLDMGEIDDDDLVQACKKRGLTIIPGSKGSTEDLTQVVERAFLSCRDRPDMPQELKDLFWKVHDRAMP